MSLTSLCPAIKTRAEAATGLSALGTLWFEEDPPLDAMPYFKFATYGLSKVNQAFGTKYFQDYQIQFDIYTTALTTAATYQDALHTSFDNCSMTLGSGKLLCSRRVMDVIRKATYMTDKDGKPVWQAVSRYVMQVDKTF